MNVEQARFNLIEQQIRPCDISEADVLDNLRTTPREAFVPEASIALAFSEASLPLAHDQVMMTPVQEAKILQALALEPHHEVLEIGTGSGYLTALLAKQAHHVVSEEFFADLSHAASEKLKQHGIENVSLQVKDSLQNRSLTQRYDRIAVTGALPVYDPMFQHQLNIGGRLFIVTGTGSVMQAHLIRRLSEREWDDEVIFETHLPALIGARSPEKFAL